jgi:protein quaking
MHPSPRGPNFCGNGFGPWNGMHPEVFGLATKVIMPSSVVASTALYICVFDSMLDV